MTSEESLGRAHLSEDGGALLAQAAAFSSRTVKRTIYSTVVITLYMWLCIWIKAISDSITYLVKHSYGCKDDPSGEHFIYPLACHRRLKFLSGTNTAS